jgi:hypothetical protein
MAGGVSAENAVTGGASWSRAARVVGDLITSNSRTRSAFNMTLKDGHLRQPTVIH